MFTDHFRQAGVTPQISIIYFLIRSRIFIFGGLVMNSTIPADLLELKARFETWRANRKYMREPIPDELWNAAAGRSRRYPTPRVGRYFLHQRRRRFYSAKKREIAAAAAAINNILKSVMAFTGLLSAK